MDFKQFYLGCLSHASYYLGSDSGAVVIDPQRDIQQYLDEAASHGQTIRYIIETHSHADFVSGHIELAAKTGAQIIYGQRANTQFPTLKVKTGDTVSVGEIKLQFLETPGHTPEGITVVAEDMSDPLEPLKMFTGDTLFVGDVGRPDLIGSAGHTAEEMAGMLYESINKKILPWPDDTEIYPAHGAGSLCGKSLSKETWSTLGAQREHNYALQPMSRDEFVRIVTADQPEVPIYFARSSAKNLEGAAALSEIAKPRHLAPHEIESFDGVVVDVRPIEEYGAGHIANSINIGLGGQFASWAGTLVPIGTPIALVAKTIEQVDEAITRLARVGHETVTGHMLIDYHPGGLGEIKQVPVERVNELIKTASDIQFVDVRRPSEHSGGHAPGAINIPLDKLADDIEKLDPKKATYVICQGGYRSSIGTGILENAGFDNICNVTGGTAAWIAAGLEIEAAASVAAG